MESVLKDFEYLIQKGLNNKMPLEAKLIILGQIIYAVEREDLTIEEGWELEKMLGGRQQHENALEYAIFGDAQETVAPS
ncbi:MULTISPECIES: hypothetical protein [Kamptonema]